MIRHGSVEILGSDGESSEGLTILTPDPARLPEALAITRALGEFAPVDPPREGADLEWTARTHDGFPVVVLFRETILEGPRFTT